MLSNATGSLGWHLFKAGRGTPDERWEKLFWCQPCGRRQQELRHSPPCRATPWWEISRGKPIHGDRANIQQVRTIYMYCMPNGQTHIARRGDIIDIVWEGIGNAQRSHWAHPYCPGSSESSSGEIGAVTTLPQRRTFCIFKHRLPRNRTKYGLIGHQQIDLEPNYQMSRCYQWLFFINVVFIKDERNSYFGPLTSFSCKLISGDSTNWIWKKINLILQNNQCFQDLCEHKGDILFN